MTGRRKRGRRKSRRKTSKRRFPWFRLLFLIAVLFAGYVVYLDFQVRHEFTGKRWSLPARVYARPLELYAGASLDADRFAAELQALQYRPVQSPRGSGEYSRNRDTFHLVTRPFTFWDGQEEARNLKL